MRSSLDALEAAFLMNDLAIRSESYHSAHSVLSRVLDRQSLAEIAIDHNRGLREALKLARECKAIPCSALLASALKPGRATATNASGYVICLYQLHHCNPI